MTTYLHNERNGLKADEISIRNQSKIKQINFAAFRSALTYWANQDETWEIVALKVGYNRMQLVTVTKVTTFAKPAYCA